MPSAIWKDGVNQMADWEAKPHFMNKLSKLVYLSTFNSSMQRLAEDAEPPFDFWDYAEAIPAADYEGKYNEEGTVSYVWQDATGQYQHVLLDTTVDDLYMVIILDLENECVFGHYLLDLKAEYGIPRE